MVSTLTSQIARGSSATALKGKYRLFNAQNKTFLHASGNGETDIRKQSWLGTLRQAEELARRAQIRGEEFPFKALHRETFNFQPDTDPKGSDR